jgi:hypothetical protein
MKYSLRSLMRFSIRDLALVTVIVAMVLGWWVDRWRLRAEAVKLAKDGELSKHTSDFLLALRGTDSSMLFPAAERCFVPGTLASKHESLLVVADFKQQVGKEIRYEFIQRENSANQGSWRVMVIVVGDPPAIVGWNGRISPPNSQAPAPKPKP